MQRRVFKPHFVLWCEVQINDRSKAEGKKRARNLRAVGGPKLRVGVDRVIIQSSGVANVHVRIDESWDQEPPCAVDPLRAGTVNNASSNANNAPIADDYKGVGQRNL